MAPRIAHAPMLPLLVLVMSACSMHCALAQPAANLSGLQQFLSGLDPLLVLEVANAPAITNYSKQSYRPTTVPSVRHYPLQLLVCFD